MASFTARALHYVFRVANRKASHKFYIQTLGMKVLRHEEFREPCKANCNGPFDGMWSKTMVGYGGEDEHFVLELTYNYGVHSYELGNYFHSIQIESDDVLTRVQIAAGERTALLESRDFWCQILLATVWVVILRDPNEHEIYFVGDEGFQELSKVDAEAEKLLMSAIEKDDS